MTSSGHPTGAVGHSCVLVTVQNSFLFLNINLALGTYSSSVNQMKVVVGKPSQPSMAILL